MGAYRTAYEQDLGRNLQLGYQGDGWKDEDVALLGQMTDDEIGRQTGRTVNAVRQKRELLNIPNPTSPAWTEKEKELQRRLPPQEAAKQTGRTLAAVHGRWTALEMTTLRHGLKQKRSS